MITRHMRGARPLPVSVLGFGGAPLGNLFTAISDQQAEATLRAAWDSGVRLFDTAPFYGLGLSEERFGRTLADYPRNEWVLSTKIGRVLEDCAPGDLPQTQFVDTPSRSFQFDYSYDGIMRSHEGSLRRLGLDRIDVLLVHDIDIWTHGSAESAAAYVRQLFDQGGFRALDELRASGAIRSIGGGLNEWQACENLLRHGDFDCFLLAGRYTLLEQEALDSFLPLCEERKVSIILGGPFNSGILATGPVPGALYQYHPAPEPILERVRHIEAICARHSIRLIEAALQFVLGHPTVVSVIPGANSPEQVRANAKLLEANIPAALWDDLKAEGLLRADAPVPASPLL